MGVPQARSRGPLMRIATSSPCAAPLPCSLCGSGSPGTPRVAGGKWGLLSWVHPAAPHLVFPSFSERKAPAAPSHIREERRARAGDRHWLGQLSFSQALSPWLGSPLLKAPGPLSSIPKTNVSRPGLPPAVLPVPSVRTPGPPEAGLATSLVPPALEPFRPRHFQHTWWPLGRLSPACHHSLSSSLSRPTAQG